MSSREFDSVNKPFELVKSDVYSHPLFAQIKQEMNKEEAKDERWFWQMLKQELGFNLKRCGKHKNKYRIYSSVEQRQD